MVIVIGVLALSWDEVNAVAGSANVYRDVLSLGDIPSRCESLKKTVVNLFKRLARIVIKGNKEVNVGTAVVGGALGEGTAGTN